MLFCPLCGMVFGGFSCRDLHKCCPEAPYIAFVEWCKKHPGLTPVHWLVSLSRTINNNSTAGLQEIAQRLKVSCSVSDDVTVHGNHAYTR